MNPRSTGASAASVFAGISAAGVIGAGLLLPAAPAGGITDRPGPCQQAAASPSPSPSPSATAPVPAVGLTLCLWVKRLTRARDLLPGSTARYSIQVWLAVLPASTAPASPSPASSPAPTATPSPSATTSAPVPTPSAANVTVTFRVGAGGLTPQFTACPALQNNGACSLGPLLLPGPPASTLHAGLAIPTTASKGQRLTFTVYTATDSPGVLTPASTQAIVVTTRTAPSPRPSPASSPSESPAITGPTPLPSIGATLPAGTGIPAASGLGTLPPPTSPGVTLPPLTPGPVPSPAPLLGVANVSGQFPLARKQISAQLAGLAALAAALTIALARLTLRRRPPSRPEPRNPR